MVDALRVVSGTRVITQGATTVQITKEALEDAAQQANGARAIPLTLEHDPSLMPLGKVQEAWVEQSGKEHLLIARVSIEDSYLPGTHMRSGTELVTLLFADDPRPFILSAYTEIFGSSGALSIDLANFDSTVDYERFRQAVTLVDDSIACDNSLLRHSVTPEPIIQFVVSNPDISIALAVGTWMLHRVERFVRYTVDETLRKTADDISDALSMKLKGALKAYNRHRSHDTRPTTTQLIVPGGLTLVLLAKTEPNGHFANINLASLVVEMEKYGDILLKADKAVFQKSRTDAWQFVYLTTRSGEVIGSQDCCKRSVEAALKIGQGQSFGGQIPRDEQ